MQLVHVIPIVKGLSRETLSYFSAQNIGPGSIVTIPLRSKNARGIVIGTEPAEQSKTTIRTATFPLKKIERVRECAFLLPAFIRAAGMSADYFATTSGAILHTLIPRHILANIPTGAPPVETKSAKNFDTLPRGQKYILQAEEEERFSHYRSIIREEFARKMSVLFILPTIEETERTARLLEKGIEQYTLTFHGELTARIMRSRWRAVIETPHPVLIVATGFGFSLPRPDIGTIILERESSRAYKMPARPFLDIRMFAEHMSAQTGARLIFGDSFLRVETQYRHGNDEFMEIAPLKYRALSSAKHTIVDMRAYKSANGSTFTVLSNELKELIRRTKTHNERLFIFTLRRGLAPLTVCSDCGSVVFCEYCTAPVVLRTADEDLRVFVCNKCGAKRAAEDRCRECSSWRITPLGIGSETVEEQVRRYAPEAALFVIDRDRTKTRKHRNDVMRKFAETPAGILIGTEAALPHLSHTIDNTAVASIDSLFSIPDFRIHEKILNLLLVLRSATSGTFLLQTRNIGETVLDFATKGNLIDFYRKELEERKRFSFPPYSTLIKISRSGLRDAIEKDMEKIGAHFAPYTPHIFPAFIAMVREKYIMHALIKVPHGGWIDKALLAKLREIPPQFSVNVDPESIL